jgi:chromosome segregation ATPase
MSDNQILAALTRIGDRLDAMDARFDKMDGRFDAMDARFDKMDGRFDAMDGRFNATDERLDRMEGTINATYRRVERMEIKVDRTADDMADVKVGLIALEQINAAKTVVSATQSNQIARLDSRVSLIERRLELRDGP